MGNKKDDKSILLTIWLTIGVNNRSLQISILVCSLPWDSRIYDRDCFLSKFNDVDNNEYCYENSVTYNSVKYTFASLVRIIASDKILPLFCTSTYLMNIDRISKVK